MATDLFQTLGVSANCSSEELKRAFRKLALQHHPDRHQLGSESERREAAAQFKAITQAYEVLSDNAKRQAYVASLYRAQAESGSRSHASHAPRASTTSTPGYSGRPGGQGYPRSGGQASSYGHGFRQGFSPGYGSTLSSPAYLQWVMLGGMAGAMLLTSVLYMRSIAPEDSGRGGGAYGFVESARVGRYAPAGCNTITARQGRSAGGLHENYADMPLSEILAAEEKLP